MRLPRRSSVCYLQLKIFYLKLEILMTTGDAASDLELITLRWYAADPLLFLLLLLRVHAGSQHTPLGLYINPALSHAAFSLAVINSCAIPTPLFKFTLDFWPLSPGT
jgi:hypothetical protein